MYICIHIVDAARGTGPSASLDYGWPWLCIFSDPIWIRTLKEFWRVFVQGPTSAILSNIVGPKFGPWYLDKGPLARVDLGKISS